jgi:hypothetical protein
MQREQLMDEIKVEIDYSHFYCTVHKHSQMRHYFEMFLLGMMMVMGLFMMTNALIHALAPLK